MKDGVFIINAARGGVINENDLIKFLDNGKIAGVALDVFENEPNPNKKLLSHPLIEGKVSKNVPELLYNIPLNK